MGLKPCPFCGGENVLLEYDHITGTYVVRCRTCQTIVWQYYVIADEAIEAWNRRVSE